MLAAVSDVLTKLGFEDFTIRLNHRALLTGAARARRRAARRCTATRSSRSTSSTRSASTACRRSSWPAASTQRSRRRVSAALRRSGRRRRRRDALARVDEGDGPHDAVGQSSSNRDARRRHGRRRTRIRVDPSLARGLSYYTGAIMEIAVPDLAGQPRRRRPLRQPDRHVPRPRRSGVRLLARPRAHHRRHDRARTCFPRRSRDGAWT